MDCIKGTWVKAFFLCGYFCEKKNCAESGEKQHLTESSLFVN